MSPDDLFGRGHAPTLIRIRPLNARVRLHGFAELTAACGDDTARTANLVFFGGERDRHIALLLRFVCQPARLRIEGELVAVTGIGDGLRTLHDVQAEIEGVFTKDVAHVVAADHDHFQARFFGHAFESRRAHLARRSTREAIAGNQKRLSAVHSFAKIWHEVPEGSGLPALVQRLEAFGNAIRSRRDLIGVDGVELLFLAWDLQIPEDERFAANQSAGRSPGGDVSWRRDRLQ
jgi:hypothetical protein